MDVLIEKKTPKNLNHYKFFDKNKRKISNNATAAGPRRDGKKNELPLPRRDSKEK